MVIESSELVRSAAAVLRAPDAVGLALFEAPSTSSRMGIRTELEDFGTDDTLLTRLNEVVIAVSEADPALVSEVIARRESADFFRRDCPPVQGS